MRVLRRTFARCVAEQLERDLAMQLRVPGAEDVAEAAAPDPIEHDEPAPAWARRLGDGRRVRARSALAFLGGNASIERGDALDEAEVADQPALGVGRLRLEALPVDGLPSATEAARSASARSSALNVHLLRQPHERAGHGHPRGIRAGLAVRRGNLLVTLLHFHACDDDLPFVRFQALHRRFVAFERLGSDRFLERRRARIARIDCCRPILPAAGYRFRRLTSSRTRLTSACRRYAWSAPSCLGSNWSMRLSVCAIVSCTRSSVSRRSRVQRGSRPRAHRRSGGRCRRNKSFRASASPARARRSRSAVEVRLADGGGVDSSMKGTDGSCHHGRRS